jgi:hypothetical protein
MHRFYTQPHTGNENMIFPLLLPLWSIMLIYQFLDHLQMVGLLGWVISSSPLSKHREMHAHARTHTHTKHLCPEWDSSPRSRLPSERRQFDSDCSATVTSQEYDYEWKNWDESGRMLSQLILWYYFREILRYWAKTNKEMSEHPVLVWYWNKGPPRPS